MLNVICKTNCASCYAQVVCALSAIVSQDGAIYVDTDKCIGCSTCRTACMTFSLDKQLQRKGGTLDKRVSVT